nr:hypothetical protein [Pseudidiomarina homiensis]
MIHLPLFKDHTATTPSLKWVWVTSFALDNRMHSLKFEHHARLYIASYRSDALIFVQPDYIDGK